MHDESGTIDENFYGGKFTDVKEAFILANASTIHAALSGNFNPEKTRSSEVADDKKKKMFGMFGGSKSAKIKKETTKTKLNESEVEEK